MIKKYLLKSSYMFLFNEIYNYVATISTNKETLKGDKECSSTCVQKGRMCKPKHQTAAVSRSCRR